MRQVLGSWSLQFTPQEDKTLKGPWHLGASFAFGRVVCTLVPFNHTRSPGLNLYVAVVVFVHLITSAATVNAAVTSDLI
jgi:hypothetical protein